VKGKTNAIRIYELLGQRATTDEPAPPFVVHYEEAFALYTARDFAGALRVLEKQAGDAPSAVLAERCREFLAHPPPADWSGIYVSMSK